MSQEAAGELFVRFCLAGPLLYIGLIMMTDPKGLVSFISDFSHALQTLQQRGINPRLIRLEAPPFARHVLRFAGATLCSIALLFLSGVAG